MSVETFRLDLTANVHCHVLFELSNCSFLAKTLSSSDQVFATTNSDTENYLKNKNKAKKQPPANQSTRLSSFSLFPFQWSRSLCLHFSSRAICCRLPSAVFR